MYLGADTKYVSDMIVERTRATNLFTIQIQICIHSVIVEQ